MVKLVWSARSDEVFCTLARPLYDVSRSNPRNMFSVHLHNSAAPIEAYEGRVEVRALRQCAGLGAMHTDHRLIRLRSVNIPIFPFPYMLQTRADEAYVRSIINRGRPKLAALLQQICRDTAPQNVMVMACGPEAMVQDASEAAFSIGCGFHSEEFAF